LRRDKPVYRCASGHVATGERDGDADDRNEHDNRNTCDTELPEYTHELANCIVDVLQSGLGG